jgi:23S rRNA (uracil1939-C5)-methyltransferase
MTPEENTQPDVQTITVSIHEVAFPGRGVGRLEDGRVIFIDGALPGETVEVALTREHKRFAEGRLIAVTTPSAERIEPACPLAAKGTCPGCTYQHATYEEELRIKSDQLESLLKRIGHVEAPNMIAAMPSPSPMGYRNKITLHTGRKHGGKALGYHGHNHRTIVNVTACPLAMPPIQALLDKRRADPTWLKTLPRDSRVTFRHAPANGTFWWQEHAPRLGGPRQLTEKTYLGDLTVPRTAFYQVNPALADILLKTVGDMLVGLEPARVIDAFCGVGIFAFAAAHAGIKEVCGFDTHPDAIGCARSNAEKLGLKACTFFSAPANEAFERIKPIAGTALILDPPRAGLEDEVLKQICELNPDHILYVSCAPDTLARDVRHLREKGEYKQVSSQVFDMFARTASFESLTLLSK